MGKVLFEITEDNLDTGLRGYPVGYCTTSHVDPIKGLFYLNYPVADIAYWEPERAIHLLYAGKDGSAEEIEEFSQSLKKNAVCSSKVIEHIRKLPSEGHPMQLFCAALFICGMVEGQNDYQKDCLSLIAKIPEIAATVINYHAGWGESKPSNPDLGYMENFVHMLNVPRASPEELIEVFKVFNVLHLDHGGGNLSTFVGKAVASGLQDMYGSIAAALSALAGPRHGRANQDCLEFIQEIQQELKDDITPESVEALIRKRLANDQLLFGFGHAVLRVEDPRATVFYTLAEKKYPDHPLVKLTHILRTVAPKVLAENPKISDPYPNVDAISGTVLSAAGFPYPEYFTLLFGLARAVGISIQIVYERCIAREGKGLPIVRPKYLFKSSPTA
ncbi:citrate (Si)-synthase [Parachlamydia sp. AcF125]|uniref:citrate (Si)-synthase n=1 Tax=Parachlamydia sp. AcF125 TaxID=2795736 RepID=UPI001BC9625E|nr:citrate (Si)-synthase [Parachlamydia sp. AcF125]MBS4168415.1 Citrate synthase [Parachlamydia sp. AcF125]